MGPPQAEGARVLTTGEGLTTGLILTAANGAFLRKHPELGKRYLAVHARALEFIAANHALACALVARETGIGVDDVKRLIPDYDFRATVTDEDYRSLSDIQNFLLEYGIITRPVDIQSLFWRQGVRMSDVPGKAQLSSGSPCAAASSRTPARARS